MRQVEQQVQRVLRFLREHGLVATSRLAWQRFAASGFKYDIVGRYGFVAESVTDSQPGPDPAPVGTINWFLPDLSPGSGGHLNALRFIRHLESREYICRIVLAGQMRTSRMRAEATIREWYGPVKAPIYVGAAAAPAARLSVATSWRTAYAVRAFRNTHHRAYLVQDFEPWFFPPGSEYAFAEETYRFGFIGITAGPWLAGKLATEYGMTTSAVGFSVDKQLFQARPRVKSSVRRVFFYARPSTPRRAFELGILALDAVSRRLRDVEVVLAGGDLSGFIIPFKYRDVGRIEVDQLPDLYRSCDVALILSFSNLSLLPLELMACGTPVVSNRGPNVEWLLNDSNARLAHPTVTDLADALCEVLENPSEADRLRNAGIALADSTSWMAEADKMAAMFHEIGVDEP